MKSTEENILEKLDEEISKVVKHSGKSKY